VEASSVIAGLARNPNAYIAPFYGIADQVSNDVLFYMSAMTAHFVSPQNPLSSRISLRIVKHFVLAAF
jgi:hypothetical protein